MTSAQVLPNSATTSSRKHEHLHAGKRLLEEFRKKKAAGQAKKVAPKNQPHVAGVGPDARQPLETEVIRHTNTNDAGSSSGADRESSGAAISNDEYRSDADENSERGFSNDKHISPHPTNGSKAVPAVAMPSLQTHDMDTLYGASGYNGPTIDYRRQNMDTNDGFGISSRFEGTLQYERPDRYFLPRSQVIRDNDSGSSQSNYSGTEEAHLSTSSALKVAKVTNPVPSDIGSTNLSPENPGRTVLQNKSDFTSRLPNGHISSLYEGIRSTSEVKESNSEIGYNIHDGMQLKDDVTSVTGRDNLSSYVGYLQKAQSGPSLASEPVSSIFSFNAKSPSNHESIYPATAENKTRRSRPSFLDSLTMPTASSPTPSSFIEPKNDGLFMSNSSAAYNTSSIGPYTSHNPLINTRIEEPFSKLGSSNVGADMLRQSIDERSIERNSKYQSSKHDEDFASLEQHIEDLTQEKFSLQRAVEASRALAESLAAENSSLTESYNQQGSIVNQLKSEMEILQEEIKAQLTEVESVKMEYGNVLLECNAADERGKLLASEVIGLEEKALRLRSNELKLERQLENSYAEMASYKKKLSSIEKDRQDLLSTINALQEEKKLLQNKLRNASVSEKSIDVSKSPTKTKDTSTSTEDLDPTPDTSNPEICDSSSVHHDDASSSTLLPESKEFKVELSSVNIPPDQITMIRNIDILISEIAFEKEELIKALAQESSHTSTLKDLNKELSRKLETQTQRLELLTAQSMANGSNPTRQSDTQKLLDNSAYVDQGLPTYADEGDEVVERVLGWIMNLFPGGPTKRRTSKLI